MGLIKVPRRRIRANFLPDFPVEIDRKDSIGARVVEYLPLNGRPALVSGMPVTLNTGVVQVGQRGRNLRCPSGYAAAIPLNLSKYGTLAFAFWAYVDAYTNTDKMFLELTASGDANPGGFFIDPDSGSAGRFDVVATGSVAGYNTFNNARPVASWNHYIVEIDLSVTGGFISLALNGVNMPSTGATASTGSPAVFANSTLFIGGRSGGVFPLVGNIQGVTIINGRLTANEKLALYANSNRVLKPANDSISIPVSAGVPGAYTLTANSASFSLTGQSAGLKADRRLSAQTATFGLTGNTAAIKADRRLSATTASFAVTGIDAALTYNPLAKTLTATVGSFVLTGNATALRTDRRLSAVAGSYALTAQAANLRAARHISAQTASYAITGNTAGLRAARRLMADAAGYTLTGIDVGLTKSNQRTLSAATASFALTGIAATLKADRRLLAQTGQIVLTANAAGLARGYRLAATTGAYALTGQAAAFRRAYRLAAIHAQFAITGHAANLVYTPNVAGVFAFSPGSMLSYQRRITKVDGQPRIRSVQ